jgi:hypothetical protein
MGAAALADAAAFGHVDGLTVGMGVPGGPGPVGEVDVEGSQAGSADGAATVSK